MLIIDLLGWWYSRGWLWLIKKSFITRSQAIAGFFSIVDLLKTLFSPFRQDSLNIKNAPISVRLQALGENIISRSFGLIIRTTLILVGSLLLVLNLVLGIVITLIWPLMPLTPILVAVLINLEVGL